MFLARISFVFLLLSVALPSVAFELGPFGLRVEDPLDPAGLGGNTIGPQGNTLVPTGGGPPILGISGPQGLTGPIGLQGLQGLQGPPGQVTPVYLLANVATTSATLYSPVFKVLNTVGKVNAVNFTIAQKLAVTSTSAIFRVRGFSAAAIGGCMYYDGNIRSPIIASPPTSSPSSNSAAINLPFPQSFTCSWTSPLAGSIILEMRSEVAGTAVTALAGSYYTIFIQP